ncbi:hypothetical protein WA026_014476 [Henosepilachna vigintioctopunctata]|uniref:Uncharacterized protein n=1 Tax=Henosepilachna vigintioctopunctata TaxID=420089 RepID=A0AAW1UBW9_9CUCU
MTMFLVLILGFGVASSLNLGHPEGLHFNVDGEYASSYEDYKPRDYKFEYGVSDPHTGDHKSHWEVRENGVVRGEYSLLEPDGTTRVVQYTADDHGFRAVVKKLGHAVHPSQHQLDLHNTPIIIPEIHGDKLEQSYFKSYDGNAENYVNALDDSNLISLLGDNHQILENAAPTTHIQEPITLPHSVSGNVAGHHSYPSYEVESITQNQETYSHEFLPNQNDHHVPTQQESLHIAEPISYHPLIQEFNPNISQSITAMVLSHLKKLLLKLINNLFNTSIPHIFKNLSRNMLIQYTNPMKFNLQLV